MSDLEGEDISRVGQFEQQAEVWEEDELSVCFSVEEVCVARDASEGFAVLQVDDAGEQRVQVEGFDAGLRRGAGLCEQTVEQRTCVSEEQRVERVEQREEVVVAG